MDAAVSQSWVPYWHQQVIFNCKINKYMLKINQRVFVTKENSEEQENNGCVVSK